VLARLETGDESKDAWDEVVGPYARNARYRGFLWNFHSDPKQEQRLRRFMTAVGDAYNRRVPSGRRVTHLEAQQWNSAWDDPRAGRLAHRLVVDFPPDGDGALAKH
jgi:hypothetical protein